MKLNLKNTIHSVYTCKNSKSVSTKVVYTYKNILTDGYFWFNTDLIQTDITDTTPLPHSMEQIVQDFTSKQKDEHVIDIHNLEPNKDTGCISVNLPNSTRYIRKEHIKSIINPCAKQGYTFRVYTLVSIHKLYILNKSNQVVGGIILM